MVRRPPAAQRGIALVMALWLTVLLTVIASGFAFSMRNEAIAARNAMSLAQARAVADGAVERTLYELSRPRTSRRRGRRTGAACVDEATACRSASPPSTKRRRSTSTRRHEVLLKGLMMQVGGLDVDAAARIVDAILDWRDADDLRRPNGAEQADYRAANLKYGPANAPFVTVGELGRVLGMTPERSDACRAASPSIRGKRGSTPLRASRGVLLALPNATAEAVDTYLAARTDALEASLAVPPSRRRRALASAQSPVWRIRAETLLPDGVTFIREAVVRPVADARRPLIVLAWQDGARASAAPASSDAASDFQRRHSCPLIANSPCPVPVARAATSRAGSGSPDSGAGGGACSPRSSRPDRARRSSGDGCVR